MMVRLIADREKRRDASGANGRDHSSCLEVEMIQVTKGSTRPRGGIHGVIA